MIPVDDSEKQQQIKYGIPEAMWVAIILQASNQVQYGDLVEYCRKAYTNKQNLYPKNILDMVEVMHQQPAKKKSQLVLRVKRTLRMIPKNQYLSITLNQKTNSLLFLW